METYKSAKDKMRKVEISPVDKTKYARENIEYLNGINQKKLEYR